MRHHRKFLAGAALLGSLSLFLWAFGDNNGQLKKDVEARMAGLHQTYQRFLSDRKEMISVQQDLASPTLTFDQRQALQAKVGKDRDAMEAESSTLLGDINYLQTNQANWELLPQEEKDFVIQVSGSL